MRANEITTVLRDKGYEKGTQEILFRICEEMNEIRQTNKHILQLIDKLSAVLSLQDIALQGMKDKVEKKDDDESSTQGMLFND